MNTSSFADSSEIHPTSSLPQLKVHSNTGPHQTEKLLSNNLIARTYLQYCSKVDHLNPLEQIVADYLENRPPSQHVFNVNLESLLDKLSVNSIDSPLSLIMQWRKLLVLLLIAKEHDLTESGLSLFVRHMQYLCQNILWDEFQLLSAYQAIVSHLLQYPSVKPTPFQYSSKAAPLEYGKHWEWAAVPIPCLHAELGTLWCLYASLTGDKHYLMAAEKLAEWQLNTISSTYAPFVSLYSHEGDATESDLALRNYSLFHAVAAMTKRADMTFHSERQLEYWKSIYSDDHDIVPFDIAILTIFLPKENRLKEQKKIVEAATLLRPLAPYFEDDDVQLAGCRSPEESVFATLSGCGSAMGGYYRGQVQVLGFGPQHTLCPAPML